MGLFYLALITLISCYEWIHHFFTLKCMHIEIYECCEDSDPIMYQNINSWDQEVECKILCVLKDYEVVRSISQVWESGTS